MELAREAAASRSGPRVGKAGRRRSAVVRLVRQLLLETPARLRAGITLQAQVQADQVLHATTVPMNHVVAAQVGEREIRMVSGKVIEELSDTFTQRYKFSLQQFLRIR